MKGKAKQPKGRKDKGKKHERPLSLFGLSFDDAVGKLLAAKPESKVKKAKPDGGQNNV